MKKFLIVLMAFGCCASVPPVRNAQVGIRDEARRHVDKIQRYSEDIEKIIRFSESAQISAGLSDGTLFQRNSTPSPAQLQQLKNKAVAFADSLVLQSDSLSVLVNSL